MRGSQRIFFAALLLSLLAHFLAAGSSGRWWTAPAREIPFPIEARLDLADQPVAKTVAVPANRPEPGNLVAKPSAAKPVVSTPPPASESVPAPEIESATPALAPAIPPILVPEPQIEPVKEQAEPVQPASAPGSAPPQARSQVVRSLPERIALSYSVQSGEDGFTLGQSTYSGWIRKGRYSLTSVTEATGITSLFVSGKITQRSEGSLTAEGLQPDKFWGEKGERLQPPVRFDWPQKQLMLPAGAVELPMQTQDLLSFPFHLAMLVQEGASEWVLPVTNGKKLRNYRFQVIGRESLKVAAERMETLRLQGSRSGEGSLDVWLAPARNWLPVRIRTQDQKGKVIVLTLLDSPN